MMVEQCTQTCITYFGDLAYDDFDGDCYDELDEWVIAGEG